MRIEKRGNGEGTYYSFVFYDTRTKKPIRITKEEIQKRFGHDITSEEEAKQCLKLLEAQFETEKIKIERRLSWEKEFYNFPKLLEEYAKSQRKSAPNSWENSVFYMKHYVLPFFLSQKKLNKVDLWEDYFDEFREWLESGAKLIRADKLISYSSKNHAIKSLNTFLGHLFRKKLISRLTKCESFGSHLINKRTIDDVVHPQEMEQIYQALKEKGHKKEATFFRYLFFSGMRFSEGLAISMADLYQGWLPNNQLLAKKLNVHGITYHGYIVSDSQVDENWNRHPFKGKKEISESLARTIPITDKVLWNDLVELAEEQFNRWNGTLCLDKGLSLTFVRDNLRHSNISITSQYLHLTKESRNKVKDLF